MIERRVLFGTPMVFVKTSLRLGDRTDSREQLARHVGQDSYKDSAATRWIRCQGRPLSRLEGRVQRRRTQRCSARLSLDQANGHHFLPAGTMLDRSTVVLFEDVTTKPGLSLSFLSEVLPDGCSVTNESRLLEQLPPGCVAPRRSCSCSETISPFGPPTCRIPAAPRRPRHAPSSRARARAAPRGTHGTPVTRPRGGGESWRRFPAQSACSSEQNGFSIFLPSSALGLASSGSLTLRTWSKG